MLLQELPSGLRPREKMLAMGPQALTDAELLALVLRTGLRGCGVLELAHQLLARFRGLSGLLGTSLADLQMVRGLGGAAMGHVPARRLGTSKYHLFTEGSRFNNVPGR